MFSAIDITLSLLHIVNSAVETQKPQDIGNEWGRVPIELHL